MPGANGMAYDTMDDNGTLMPRRQIIKVANTGLNLSDANGKTEIRLNTSTAVQPVGAAEDGGVSAQAPRVDHVHGHGTHTADYHTNYVQESATMTRTIYIPRTSFTLDDATAGTGGTAGAAPPELIAFGVFADADRQAMYTTMVVPDDWASGGLDFTLLWGAATATAGNVRWALGWDEVGVGTSPVAASTITEQTGTGDGTINLKSDTWTDLFTPSAAGIMFKLYVERLGANAADTLTASARAFAVIMKYTANVD